MTKVTETLGGCPVETTLAVIGGKWKPADPLASWRGQRVSFFGIATPHSRNHVQNVDSTSARAGARWHRCPQNLQRNATTCGILADQICLPAAAIAPRLCNWGSKHEAYASRNGTRSAPKMTEPAPKRMAIAI